MNYLLNAALATLLIGVPAFAQKELLISAVQGDKYASDHVNQQVKVTGIVTARIRSGFFVQTPDAKSDANPLTSEGIYVFTRNEPPADAAIGNEVTVTGKVEEFRHRNETFGLTITEINHFVGRDSLIVISRGNPLPRAIVLSHADFKANAVDQLERFEGMRVQISELSVVAPTGGRVDPKTETVQSDGVFFGVLKGTPRPFREPGMSILQAIASEERERWKKEIPRLPIFDGNPEVLRIDSGELEGSRPANVFTRSEIRGLTGIVHYAFSRYTILAEPLTAAQVAGQIKPIAMPAPTDRQFSVAATNIETFVDDADDPDLKEDVASTEAFQKRLGKISVAVRDYLTLPDIIAVTEAENLNVLKQLAARINADAVASGKADPKYDAFLFEGNDPRSIDCGFLVKTSRVTVTSAKQFGKEDRYRNPVTGNEDVLNDRPPIIIETTIRDPKTNEPFALTVVANHLKSFRGIDDPKDGPNVRMKKKLQAEFLARWVSERQNANPAERILLVGDFNAFQFNDGLVDQIGTIKGAPTPKDAVMLASEDLVTPDLIALVDLIKLEERYSYTFDGNAQVLDHFIANQAMRKHLVGFGYLRINADYPQVLRQDGSRPERFSDHDVAVGYFTFDAAKN